MKKVKFIKSPITAFRLAYGEGTEGEFSETLANELIEAGYAVEVIDEKIETAVSKEFVETPEKKKGKK